MNTHAPTPTVVKSLLAAAALAAVALLALLALAGSPAAAAKPKVYECQHPLITGQEAVNPKGISPKAACKIVRELGAFLSTDKHIEELYECVGETKLHPGRPKLLMTEFNGWKLKLVNGYNFFMTKPGQSFRVTGQDFPVNCS
jgi:hypothetical protein